MECHFLYLDLDLRLLQEVGDLNILIYSPFKFLYLNKYQLHQNVINFFISLRLTHQVPNVGAINEFPLR